MLAPVLFTLFAAVSARNCQNLTIPVSITAQNGVFDVKLPLTKIEVTNFALNLARNGVMYPQTVQKGFETVSGTYDIAATYCEPDGGPGHELQVLTHGIGFDRSYWDFPYNNYNYSYVEKALEHGFSTFSWDRLGVGMSSKGDPLKEIQVFLEIAALQELTTQLRQGGIQGVKTKYGKVAHVGHSFGSVMTYALANMTPQLTDAIVLTGFTQVPNFVPLFALGNNFIPVTNNSALAPKYPDGYVVTQSDVGVQTEFFAEGDFDPEVLQIAYMTGQPTTPGELLTIGAPSMMTNGYNGPVSIVTGERDVPFCGGNCYGVQMVDATLPDLLQASKKYFPNAASFNTTVVPGAGHGLNLGYSHTFTYNAILEFLSQ